MTAFTARFCCNTRCISDLQRGFDALHEFLPITLDRLAKNTHRRIPGAVDSIIAEPSPFAVLLQKQPNGTAQGSRKMSDRCIDTNDQIELAYDGRGVGK